MTESNLMEYLLMFQEIFTYIKIKGISGNEKVTEGIIETLHTLEKNCPEIKIDHMVQILEKAIQDSHLPENAPEQFQKWCIDAINNLTKINSSNHNPSRLHQEKCDMDFYNLIKNIAEKSVEQLLDDAVESAKSLDEHTKKLFMEWYRMTAFDKEDKAFCNFFGYYYNSLKNNLHEFKSFYEKLADNRSRFSYFCMMSWWINFTPKFHVSVNRTAGAIEGLERTFPQYFDLDLISCDKNEVFVDCGAYMGDTVQEFIKMYGTNYKRIYSYELTPESYTELVKNCQHLNNVICRNVGVADINGKFKMLSHTSALANRLSQQGDVEVPIVTLDDDIKEDITFIKIDIEGAESAGLIGAQKHIRRTHPKLAICLYHALEDIIKLPKLIHEIKPTYKFYLRHYGCQYINSPHPFEYVLIAK